MSSANQWQLVRKLMRTPGFDHVMGTTRRRVVQDNARRLLVAQHEADRQLYRAMVSDASLPLHVRLQVQRLFETEMTRDAHGTRIQRRDIITGRPRSVRDVFRLTRMTMRHLSHRGFLPGLTKAIWG